MTCRSWWRRIETKSFGVTLEGGGGAGREPSLGLPDFRLEKPDDGHLQGLLGTNVRDPAACDILAAHVVRLLTHFAQRNELVQK
jgi:hypothetical protein